MRILLIEPYLTGSHRAWAEGYKKHSAHRVEILSMEGRYWKWRMHGGAVTLADQYNRRQGEPDLILATDMLDLTTFLALTRERTAFIPTALYFHENQLTYPWSETDRDVQQGRDHHYGFINYASALVADALFFNSEYHMQSLFAALPGYLKGFPDHNELPTIHRLKKKSQVLHLGLDLGRFDGFNRKKSDNSVPALLWNHRWEYDKNPKEFFDALYVLKEEGADFNLIILGENFSQQPDEFLKARDGLAGRLLHVGYVKSFSDYASWLYRADILPVTSRQDFFGGAVVEAMYCGVIPLLPDRLAYPWHIPVELKEDLIYREEEGVISKLRGLLNTYKSIDRDAVKAHVSRYDWARMAANYDQAFSSLLRPK